MLSVLCGDRAGCMEDHPMVKAEPTGIHMLFCIVQPLQSSFRGVLTRSEHSLGKEQSSLFTLLSGSHWKVSGDPSLGVCGEHFLSLPHTELHELSDQDLGSNC